MINICGEKLQTVVLSYSTCTFMCLVDLMKEESGRPPVWLGLSKSQLACNVSFKDEKIILFTTTMQAQLKRNSTAFSQICLLF